MADTERMEAVKRAYAEIILNTAAESAARILASERKALSFQRALAAAKQDALHMMLRLKSLMDSKLTEAETRNMLHARRIHELESQLHQAHTLILSLQAQLHTLTQTHPNNPQHPTPVPIQHEQQQENTSSYYQNVLSTDDSTCSVKDLLSTATTIPTDHASKVRSRNRCTQRVTAFDHSNDPKVTGGQLSGKNRKYKKSKENGDVKALFRRDPPRRSRTKSNYVKISKFGMKTDADVPQNGNKVSDKCIEKVKETRSDLGPGSEMGHDEAPVGLELIADNIDKEDNKSALVEPTQLTAVDSKTAETKPYSEEPDAPVPDLIAAQAFASVTEPESLPSIKYTFRRKRKRATSENNNEGFSAVVPVLEENKDKSKSNDMCNKDDSGNNEENKEDNSLEVSEERAQELKLPQGDEGVVSDSPKSSRSNRRLVQVARQLISLSTKKW